MSPERLLPALAAVFLCACSTAIPKIYLSNKSGFSMELVSRAFGLEALDISRDGQYLLTSDNGGDQGVMGNSSLRLWDMAEGRQLLRVRNDSGEIISVAISPDSKHAVTGEIFPVPGLLDKKRLPHLRIWDLLSGKVLRTHEGVEGFRGNEFNSVGYSPDGRYFLAADWASIFIFEAKRGDLVRRMTLKDYRPPRVTPYKSLVAVFSPDGKHVLSGGPDAVLRLWDVETGMEIKRIQGHTGGRMFGGICSIAFSPDGRQAITSAFSDPNVILWDLESGTEVRRFTGFVSSLGAYFMQKSLSFSPDGRHVFIVGSPLKIWDVRTGGTAAVLRDELKGIGIGGVNPISSMYHPNGRQVALTLYDAAVRIFDARTGSEVALLVGFDDGEWLTITPEGYYNASVKGASHLRVKVGKASYGVERFYDVFYRPDIVCAKLKGEDVSGLITITMDDAIRRPPPSVEFQDVPAETSSSVVKVCYQAKSAGGGIGEIRLFHNGKLIRSDGYYREKTETAANRQPIAMDSRSIYADMRDVAVRGAAPAAPSTAGQKGDAFEDCVEVDAVSGENEVSVAAFNGDNTVQSEPKTVRFHSSVADQEPRLYALAVGIDRYKDSGAGLKYAVKDAEDMKERLVGQAATLYKPENIHAELLSDDGATKAAISRKIDELSKRVRPSDSFILFAAGHGVLLQNQYYMLTHDYDGRADSAAMLSSNEIVESSKKIKALTQLIIFDTCHAGGVDAIVSGLYDARMSVLAKKMGLHVYASASSRESAMDGYKGNGLFTHALLDGLDNNRRAAPGGEDAVTVAGLGRYAQRLTVELSASIGRAQTPLILDFGKDSPLYRLR